MKHHHLKTWPEPFAAIASGAKRHEVRKNDRDYREGDDLTLERFDPAENRFVLGCISARIGHVTPGGEWGLPSDLCVFSLLNVRVVQQP